MANSEPITLVVFRRWRESGDIIALFPELPSDIYGFNCDSYETLASMAEPTITESSKRPNL